MGKLLSISLITGLALAFSGLATADAPDNYPYAETSEIQDDDFGSNVWVNEDITIVSDEDYHLRVYDEYLEHIQTIELGIEDSDNRVRDIEFTDGYAYVSASDELYKLDMNDFEVDKVEDFDSSSASDGLDRIDNVFYGDDGLYLEIFTDSSGWQVLRLESDYSIDYEYGISGDVAKHPNDGVVIGFYDDVEEEKGVTHLDSNGDIENVVIEESTNNIFYLDANDKYIFWGTTAGNKHVRLDGDLNQVELPQPEYAGSITALEDGFFTGDSPDAFYNVEGELKQVFDHDAPSINYGVSEEQLSIVYVDFPMKLTTFKNAKESEVVDSESTIPDYQTELGVITGEFSASGLESDLGLSSVFGSVLDVLFDSDDSNQDAFVQELASNTLILEDDREQMFNDYQLALDTSKGIAAGEAKVEAVKALNDQRTEDYAQEIGEERVNEFYADIERRMYAQWNREVLNFQNQLEQGKALDLTYNDAFEGVGFGDISEPAQDISVVSEKRTLLDGDEQIVYQIVDGDGYVLSLEDDLPSDSYSLAAINVDVEDDTPTIITISTYNNLLDDMYEQHANDLNNADTIISGIYDDYDAGEIDITDVLGPLEALQYLGTEYASSGSLDYAALTYEQAGLQSDLNASFTVEYQNEDMSSPITRDGQLFVSQNDFDVIETDVEYNAADKQAYMVITGEDVETVNLDGNFTVQSIENPDTGEELDETTVEDSPTYETDIEELEEQLSDYQERISELREASGFVPPNGFGFGDLGYGVIAILVAILAGVVLS